MDQFNAFHGEETNELPREWNNQPPEYQLKSKTSTLNTSPAVSATRGVLNHHAIDNGDVEVHPSEFTVKFNPESVPDPNTTTIKSIDDDEMDHLLEFFHS